MGQIERIAEVMRDGQWRTVQTISALCTERYPDGVFLEPSVSAQLRNLRKVGVTVAKQYNGDLGVFEYRISKEPTPPPVAETLVKPQPTPEGRAALIRLREINRGLGLPKALRVSCQKILKDAAFAVVPASASGYHPPKHCEPGGLALHTLEVAMTAMSLAGDDETMMFRAFTASVFHDYGKVFEYHMTTQGTKKLPFARRVGHIVFSWHFFLCVAEECGATQEDLDEIGHAILAHHGKREWGSPVTPQTMLAEIIHEADMLSARGAVVLREG